MNGGAEIYRKSFTTEKAGLAKMSHDLCVSLTTPLAGSPDFIHPKFYKLTGLKKREGFAPMPKEGLGCWGLSVYAIDYPNSFTREYFQLDPPPPLKKGTLYHVEYYVRLSNTAKKTASGFGVVFSDSIVYMSVRDLQGLKYLNMEPDIVSDSVISKKKKWELVTSDFLAKGNEKYMLIGNFYPNDKIKIELSKEYVESPYSFGSGTSYTFVDNILVEEKNQFHKLLSTNSINTSDIQFNSGNSKLNKASTILLEKLAFFLMNHKELIIQIIGHTDNVGDKNKNFILSKQRAQSIKFFLENSGIKDNRIQTLGKGDSLPIESNETAKGRQLNRRVEIKIIKD